MNMLETILSHKREEITARKRAKSVGQLEAMPLFAVPRRSLIRALKGKAMAVIAEIKKASPSKGVIREVFDPVLIAKQYVEGGASALSVLTDEKFFQGRLEFLSLIRPTVSVPLLRKDFILDDYQLVEAKAHGADAVLLIAATLEPAALTRLFAEAKRLELECLVEVHDEREVAALDFRAIQLIGINNRDLTTLETDLSTTSRVKRLLPPHVTVVSESGITTHQDLEQLMTEGIHVALIGESLMRAEDPGKALKELLSPPTHPGGNGGRSRATGGEGKGGGI